MTAELFTIATEPTAGLQRLQASLSRVGLPITILGQNEPEYWGHGWRWKTFVRAARQSSAETVIHCDGYDSVCLAPLAGMLAGFASLNHPIVFAYEKHAQPEPWLSLQPGLMIANRTALLDVFDEPTLEELFPNHFNDQYQIQSMYSWNPSAFTLDTQGTLFCTLGPQVPELVEQNGCLVNPSTGSAPSFVHAPNKWDLSKVEQWLASQD